MKENEIKTQKKPKSKGAKIASTVINTIINIMIVVVLVVSILIAVMAISSRASGISTVFGRTFQPILSDSMKGGSPDGYPSGDFQNGDLMIAKATDFDHNLTYNVGDIVTFRTIDTTTGEPMLIAHRIVDVVEGENGGLTYQTQGDNRETSPVPDQKDVKEYITAFDIGSVYYTQGFEGKILKGWGNILSFLQSQQGFFFVVLLPMIIFFMYELIRVVLNFSDYKKAVADEAKEDAVKAAVAEALADQQNKNDASLDELTPEQKEQFKQFLAMQKAQQEAEQAPPEDTDA